MSDQDLSTSPTWKEAIEECDGVVVSNMQIGMFPYYRFSFYKQDICILDTRMDVRVGFKYNPDLKAIGDIINKWPSIQHDWLPHVQAYKAIH